ncbi:MAG: nidogen-like domain-containing protein [Planctomycetota bacterium]
MRATSRISGTLALVAALVLVATDAQADPVRANAGFNASTLGPIDDAPSAFTPIGFTVDFFGTNYSSLFVNNNGNVTFDAALPAFTPFPLLTTSRVIIAPFFADVDTRTGGVVTYGTDTVDGHAAFGVNWLDVNHFLHFLSGPERNSFQLVLIDRSDIAAGDFDIEFNYRSIEWEAGFGSGADTFGIGGFSARVGYSNGSTEAFELPGSAVNGAFLDSNLVTGLIHNKQDTVDGRYIFNVRNGVVVDPIPEPSTLALLGIATAGAAWRRRRKAAKA